jgi:hypothetical protein
VVATWRINSVTLCSFAKLCVITGPKHTETVSNVITVGMNICRGLDDKAFSLLRPLHPEDD